MESEVLTFDFFGEQTRVVMKGGEPWFVASDVAEILGYDITPHMTRNLDEDEKGIHKVDTLGGKQEMTIISLSGLFAAVLKSQKEDAKKYRRWVTGEVLPKIHGEGGYITEAKQKEIEADIIDRKYAIMKEWTERLIIEDFGNF